MAKAFKRLKINPILVNFMKLAIEWRIGGEKFGESLESSDSNRLNQFVVLSN